MTPADRPHSGTWTAFRLAALGNLGAAFENVDSDQLASIADDIRSRDRIFVAGAGASHYLVKYLHFIGSMASPSFRLLELEGGSFFDDIIDMSDRDALVFLSPAPAARATIRVAEVGRERGTLVVGIIESPTMPLAALSHRLLVVPFHGPSFFRSHVAVLAIIETLVGFIISGGGPAAVDRSDRIEADRLRFEPYWDDEAARG